MNRRLVIQLVCVLLVLAASASIALSETDGISGARENVTVVASHAHESRQGRLVAYQGGERIYLSSDFDQYFDVDPVATHSRTVEYIGVSLFDRNGTPHRRVGYYRHNLSTDTRDRVWSTVVKRSAIQRPTPGVKETYRYHDIDRLNDTHLVVAGIRYDRVFIVNATADRIAWQWNATSAYPRSGGGPDYDWTHVNDVEVLHDGRIMASLRNQDQVIFLRPGEGLLTEQTLGCEGCHGLLYEQHNPDYLPGGPAVLAADSQNNRVVEYARENGSWRRTWQYQNGQMQWPRDADRLPNGHTLIADSNSHRVYEIDQQGAIVWRAIVPQPYDVERLGTGDESAGGPTARVLGLPSQTARNLPFVKLQNALLFVLPVGVVLHLPAVGLIVVGVAGTVLAAVWPVLRTRVWPAVKTRVLGRLKRAG